MEFLISSLGGIPHGIKNRIGVEFPICPGEFPGFKGLCTSLTLFNFFVVQYFRIKYSADASSNNWMTQQK
jgi:hypothetical protein